MLSNQTTTRSAHHVLEKVGSLVFLAGGLRPSVLRATAKRSVLDLPVGVPSVGTLLEIWRRETASLCDLLVPSPIPVRLVLDRGALSPAELPCDDRVVFEVSRDPREYRGTAGILRDLAFGEDGTPTDDGEYLLVVSALQLPLAPLREVVEKLASSGADVAIATHADGTPSGVKLLRRECLRMVPEIGYADFKEQALPVIAEEFDVKVVAIDRPFSMPVRDLGDYLSALRSFHEREPEREDPFAEEWRSTFSIVEEGATVSSGAVLHDSVVLQGGRVESGAFVVRSLVGPGGEVRSGCTVIDSLVSATR